MGTGIFGWGSDESGQLAAGDHVIHSTPWEVAATLSGFDIGKIKAVSAGLRHSLALTDKGEVWAWGDNRFGQLGDNLDSIGGRSGIRFGGGSLFPPIPQMGPELAPVDKPVRVYGPNGYLNAVAIAAGGNHSLALDENGNVWAWGNNQDGQLGDNTRYDRWIPVQVLRRRDGQPRDGQPRDEPLTDVKAIAAGYQHSLALIFGQQSQIYAWGNNRFGQLGDGSTEDQRGAVGVLTPRSENPVLDVWVQIAAGGDHSLACRADGTVWAWGSNNRGQLAPKERLEAGKSECHQPVQVQLPFIECNDDILQIAAGHEHSLAIVGAAIKEHAGRVLAWGANHYGQLGNGKQQDQCPPAFVLGKGGDGYLENVVAISGGWIHSLACRGDTSVWAWGNNWSGQLGNGTTNNSSTPVQVKPTTPLTFLPIAAGGQHSLASLKTP
jgi:alpha-tubulin suppressor-like RCC1 family protein